MGACRRPLGHGSRPARSLPAVDAPINHPDTFFRLFSSVNTNKPPEDYLIPTSIALDETPSVRLASVVYPAPTQVPAGPDGATMAAYEGDVTIRVRLALAPDAPPRSAPRDAARHVPAVRRRTVFEAGEYCDENSRQDRKCGRRRMRRCSQGEHQRCFSWRSGQGRSYFRGGPQLLVSSFPRSSPPQDRAMFLRSTTAAQWPSVCIALLCGHMNLRRLNAAISLLVSSNHSPFFRRSLNRSCQYFSIPAGSSVLIEWTTLAFSGS